MEKINSAENATKNSTGKKGNKKPRVPKAQQDLSDIALFAADKYNSFPAELIWLSKAQFAQMAADYSADVKSSLRMRGKRHPLTGTMEALEKEMDSNLSYVKNAIGQKFGKNRQAEYYEEFGMQLVRKSWRLPQDHNSRVESLEMMIEALTTHNITGITQDAAYWQNLHTQYRDAWLLSVTSDADLSATVGKKNLLREELVLALNALIDLIKANYPRDYKAHLREWGFQKEKF